MVMTDKIRFGYVGRLTYDGLLKLDGAAFIDRISYHLPSPPVMMVRDFGEVEITLVIQECPHCETRLMDKRSYEGRLTHDGTLRLDGTHLASKIGVERDFGEVEIIVWFKDYTACPHCGTILKEGERYV